MSVSVNVFGCVFCVYLLGVCIFSVCQSFECVMSAILSLSFVHVLIGKKVEVSLRLFDIFERNRVFIFLFAS